MLNAFRPPLLLAVALVATLPAQAEDARVRRAEVSERVRELERDGNRVLQAERMQRGGREVYRLKVLTPDGRVRVLHDGRDAPETREPPRTDRRSLMLRDRARRPMPREEREARDERVEAPQADTGRARED